MANGLVFSAEEVINLPPETVWSFVTDWSHAGDWISGVTEMRQLEDEPLNVGTILVFMAHGVRRETQVTEYEPGRRIALTARSGNVEATYTYWFEPGPNGTTHAHLEATCKLSGWWRLLQRSIGRSMARTDGTQLARLKDAIEAAAEDGEL